MEVVPAASIYDNSVFRPQPASISGSLDDPLRKPLSGSRINQQLAFTAEAPQSWPGDLCRCPFGNPEQQQEVGISTFILRRLVSLIRRAEDPILYGFREMAHARSFLAM